LIPEIPYELERVYEKTRQRYQQGSEFAIVVVAEGAKEVGHDATYKLGKDAFKEHAVLGGIAERLARQIETATGCESRSVVLGHLQRGGSPIGLDRLLAQRMGCAAVRFLAETDQSGMLAEIGGQIRLLPLDDVVGGIRNVDLHGDAVCTGRDLGICFGDEAVGTFSALTASDRPPANGASHAPPTP
jgi:6-phosphofructokinase 1